MMMMMMMMMMLKTAWAEFRIMSPMMATAT
jgi:hypothetical protein